MTVSVELDECERQILLKYRCAYGAREELEAAPPGAHSFEIDPIDLLWMAQDLCHMIVNGQIPPELQDLADALCTRLEELG